MDKHTEGMLESRMATQLASIRSALTGVRALTDDALTRLDTGYRVEAADASDIMRLAGQVMRFVAAREATAAAYDIVRSEGPQ